MWIQGWILSLWGPVQVVSFMTSSLKEKFIKTLTDVYGPGWFIGNNSLFQALCKCELPSNKKVIQDMPNIYFCMVNIVNNTDDNF